MHMLMRVRHRKGSKAAKPRCSLLQSGLQGGRQQLRKNLRSCCALQPFDR